jgi:phosphatidylethanolamine/phosphatidyl-N-methylethanolamine N-methyltransferase
MNVEDEKMLFGKWLRNPLRIGAVVPSGAALAKAMAAALGPEILGSEFLLSRPQGVVVELGGGTGSITRSLLNSGIAPRDLVVIERDEGFYRLLVQRFPDSRIIHGDAARVKHLVRAAGIRKIAAVVSGLPLLNMKPRLQTVLLRQCFDLMGPDGVFIQFTYGPVSPVPERLLARLGLSAKLADRIWLNVPPAAVWRFVRRQKSDRQRKRRLTFRLFDSHPQTGL